MTLWMNHDDVEQCIREHELIRSMQWAFKKIDSCTTSPLRVRAALSDVTGAPTNAEAMILLPGVVPGIPPYTVKVHANYPDNPSAGLPAIQGVIQLFDSSNGTLLAVIDSPLVTAHRTAAAGAVAANVLARQDAETVAIIGAGAQGEMQFRYLTHVRRIKKVFVYDVRRSAAQQYHERRTNEGFRCTVSDSIEEAVRYADIIITATWSREPFLFSNIIRPGTHITTLGPDAPGKVEVAEELIRKSKFVCDDRSLTEQMGALHTFQEKHFFVCHTNSSPTRPGPGSG
ncbi:ornithine cyclodeaminase family protein [Alicyclobacillus pomorum]|uniref:ornithine cyclodeaminase family protein n=1 Tax=Alicyclobacillus pomorum TaxID=204470 RepID=UPI0003F9C97E|nr:ornithine cyclodeaminase family protein [Alicyclobacillus pomorum]